MYMKEMLKSQHITLSGLNSKKVNSFHAIFLRQMVVVGHGGTLRTLMIKQKQIKSTPVFPAAWGRFGDDRCALIDETVVV